MLFYFLLRALFLSNSHSKFSSALPSVVFRQDPRIQPSVHEQDTVALHSVPEQDPGILHNKPEQDPGTMEIIEDILGM